MSIEFPGQSGDKNYEDRIWKLETEVRRLRKRAYREEQRGTMNKTFSTGYYLIPAGPTLGTSVTSSASANTYGSYVEMRAAAGSKAVYIAGFSFRASAGLDYGQVAIAVGASGSETVISETRLPVSPNADNDVFGFFPFVFPIPIADETRIACKVADDLASAITWKITLHVINQTDILEL